MTNSMDLLTLTNTAAAQTDRWLFLASLVVMGAFAVAVMRYFVAQHERLIADHKEARDTYQASLKGIVEETSTNNGKLMACLEQNSKVIEECRDAMRNCRIVRNP